jgi:hypothetical protein
MAGCVIFGDGFDGASGRRGSGGSIRIDGGWGNDVLGGGVVQLTPTNVKTITRIGRHIADNLFLDCFA